MVERFNGRVQREVLRITIYSHRDLETVLRGFNAAYNGRRQRVLKGFSPKMVLRQRMEADPALVNPAFKPPDPRLLRKAFHIVADVKEVSHPDTRRGGDPFLREQRPQAPFASRKAAAHRSSIASIETPAIHDARSMAAHRVRTAVQAQLYCWNTASTRRET